MPKSSLTGRTLWISWIAQLIAAAILGQTLFFKFTGAPEAVALFTRLGVEPWGRIGTGVIELIAVILLLSPPLAVYGATLAVGLMLGAITSHLAILGISVAGDGGTLFTMAWVVLLSGLLIVWLRRRELPRIHALGAGTKTAPSERS